MNQNELNEIAKQLADKPENSPEKKLLQFAIATMATRRQSEINILIYNMRFSEAEANRILAYQDAGNKLEYEDVDCWFCNGTGWGFEHGCFGSYPTLDKRCEECIHGKKMRAKLPPEDFKS